MNRMKIVLDLHSLDLRLECQVESSTTILELKQMLSTFIAIPVHQFWLTFKKKANGSQEAMEVSLNDDPNLTMEDAGIEEGDELYVEGILDRVVPVYVHHPTPDTDADPTSAQRGSALQSKLVHKRRETTFRILNETGKLGALLAKLQAVCVDPC